MLTKRHFASFAVFVLPLLFAASVGASQAQDVSYRGWGPRVGLSSSPDQVFVGAHFDLGEIAPRLAFRPNVEIGVGDDQTDIDLNAAGLYRFRTNWGAWTPYAGGEVGINFRSYDNHHGHDDDSDSGLAVNAVGGMDMKLRGGTRFGLELKLGFGDSADIKFLCHWTF